MRRLLLAGVAMAAGVLLVGIAHAGMIAALAAMPVKPGSAIDAPVPGFLTVAVLWAGGALVTSTGCVLWLRGMPFSPGGAGARGRSWSAPRRGLLYLSPAAAYLGIPMGHLLGPLLVWRLSPAPDADSGHEIRTLVEFQLTVTLFAVASVMLCALLVGFFLLAALVLCHAGLIVLSVLQALRGRSVALPLVVGFLR